MIEYIKKANSLDLLIGEEKFDVINIEPMEHQSIAVRDTIKYFSDEKKLRGKIIMPCGSGKSLTSYWILDGLRKSIGIRKTVIGVPNLILQSQMFKTFYSFLSKTTKFICIGSDEEVKDDCIDESVEVTTDEKDIISFLSNNMFSDTIVIVTYQSLNKLSNSCKALGYEFDLAIIDEAHRTIGKKDKVFSKIIFDEHIQVKRRLFMTATEKVYSGKDDEIIGMDNVDYYGKVIFDYSLAKAIKDTVLCDYKVTTIYSTSKEVDEFIKSNPYLDFDMDLSKDEKEMLMSSLLATITAIREKGCKKIVTYHSTIKKAKIFKTLLDKIISDKLLNVGSFHINGTQNSKEKFDNILNFKDAFVGILTNSQALVEGVDIPCIDCIVFCDKKESAITVIQAIGRSLRKFNGKECSYVILPILTNESDVDINNSTFKKLFSILMSISIMDERVLHEIKSIGMGGVSNKKRIIEDFINIDGELRGKIITVIDKIHLKVWNRVEGYLSYEEAKKWLRESPLFRNVYTFDDYIKNKHNLPPSIPKSPYIYYKKRGWIGWNDFMGTKPKSEKYLSFDKAKKWVQENNMIKSSEVWLKSTTILPDFIPRCPDDVYKDKGWINWADWFGKGFLDYEEAKEWLRKDSFFKNIKNQDDWSNSTNKLPFFIPKAPMQHYKKTKEWKGWGDWLGTGNFLKGDFLSYEEAKKWIKKNLLSNELNSFRKIKGKLPSFIPKNVIQHYIKTKEWKGMDDFLGKKYMSYEEAKGWIIDNDLSKHLKHPYEKEWVKIKDKLNELLPLNFPNSPRTFYRKNGTWKGWVDFLGVKKRNILNYEDTKKWIRKNKLTKDIIDKKGWDKIKDKLPLFISKDPLTYFSRQGTWKGWGDFLLKK